MTSPLAVDAPAWIQAAASIVAALATLAAIWIAYRAFRTSRDALAASNTGLALAEKSLAATFQVQFGAQLLAYEVEGDARGGSVWEKHPARISLLLRNVGNELAVRVSVSVRDAKGNALLDDRGSPIGSSVE